MSLPQTCIASIMSVHAPLICVLEVEASLWINIPLAGIPNHVAYLHPRSQGKPLLHMSLHSRSLGTSAGIVQPANPTMNSQLPDIGTIQPIRVPPVTCRALGSIRLRSSRLLAWARTSKTSCCILLTYSGVSPLRAMTPRIFMARYLAAKLRIC